MNFPKSVLKCAALRGTVEALGRGKWGLCLVSHCMWELFPSAARRDLRTIAKALRDAERSPGRRRVETTKEDDMKQWKRPVIVEIQVGMEINLYVCAKL